jgi:hypothetical protein
LELPKLALRLIIATIVVALGGKLGEMLKGGETSLALGTCGFMILKHEPQHLRHVGLRGWRRVVAVASLASRFGSHSGEKFSL